MKKVSKRKEFPVETIFELLRKQDLFVDELFRKNKFKDREEFLECLKELGDCTKGFLSNDLIFTIMLIEEYDMYDDPKMYKRFVQLVLRDLNEIRKIYVTKGLLQKELPLSIDSTKIPFSYEELFGGRSEK